MRNDYEIFAERSEIIEFIESIRSDFIRVHTGLAVRANGEGGMSRWDAQVG